jgi:hypothetical protein
MSNFLSVHECRTATTERETLKRKRLMSYEASFISAGIAKQGYENATRTGNIYSGRRGWAITLLSTYTKQYKSLS